MFDRWGESDIPDQTGRVAVVTGGNGGLGLETCRALAAAGATVVMAARNAAKASSAVDRIAASGVPGSVEVVSLDLSDLDWVARAAAEIRESHPRIDLLVNNAGLMGSPFGVTEQGFELQFGTNHLGHFALTAHLLPALLPVAGSRVVTVTSVARFRADSLASGASQGSEGYDPWGSYGRSKLANHVTAMELHRRLRAARAATASVSAHPGLTNSDLQTTSVEMSGGGSSQKFFQRLAHRTGMTVARGALSQLRAATDPEASSGELYGPRFVSVGSPVRRPVLDPRLSRWGKELWDASQEATGVHFDVAAQVAGLGGS
jgi:NAD(P)-dependent dehydrogenase (short-subunit alcohol dehydrogenase family)